MSKPMRIAGIFVGLSITSVISLILILAIVLDNPRVYRTQISDAFQRATGLGLAVNGDIGWRFFPPLAININEIEITSPESGITIASLASASIDIKIVPVIMDGGKIEINSILIDGLTVNALVSEKGIGNWEVLNSPAASPSPQRNAGPEDKTSSKAAQASESETLDLDISAFSLTNSHIEYQDLSTNTHMVLNLDDLSTGPLHTGQLTDLAATFSFDDKINKLSGTTRINGQFIVSENLKVLTLDNISIVSNFAAGKQGQPEMAASILLNGEIDTNKNTASLNDSSFSVSDMHIQFGLKANNIMDTPGLRGNISIPMFNAKAIARDLAIELPETANPDALTKLSMTADITGTTNQIVLSNINVNIDESTITGKATATVEPTMAMEFTLSMDAINMSDYMEADVESASPVSSQASPEPTTPAVEPINKAAVSTSVPDSQIIPVELLSELILKGKFTLGRLQYDEYLLQDIVVGVNNEKGAFRFTTGATGYGGNLGLQLQLNKLHSGANPLGNASVSVETIDMSKLAETDLITGITNLNSSLTFKGDMMSEIIGSLDGKSNFTISDGTLDVTSIKKVAGVIDSYRGKTSGVSQWPDMLPFKYLNGTHQFNQGIKDNQQFTLVLENMEINGSGGIDYFANTVNYDIQTTLNENEGQFSVSPALAGVKWPMNCKGSLDDSFSDLCRPDSDVIKTALANIAKNELKRISRKEQDKIKKKIEEQIPDELKEKAKKLFKGLFN